ncbi:hypothetical protein HN415_09760, partial [Candidatus Woesearchaeota archaeon]|nr:hypothetical protein [Candidatus Woesearchaeota archaeon]
ESYKQLPIRTYQIAEKFRNIKKPKGILRSKQFLMCDMVSFDKDEKSLIKSAGLFEEIAQDVFKNLNIKPIRLSKNNEKYVDYVVPCKEGETDIEKNNGKFKYSTEKNSNSITSSSVGMYFIFEEIGNKNQNIYPTYVTENNKISQVLLGTYGFGIQRCFHAAVVSQKDEYGINFSKNIRPFDVSILVINPKEELQKLQADKIYNLLKENKINTLYDNRDRKMLKEKALLSDFYGIPKKIIIGKKESESNQYLIKKRGEMKGDLIDINQENIKAIIYR